MSDSFKDRRQFVRIYRNFILSYFQKDNPERKHDISQVNNISKGGISFVATQSLEVGSILGIHLQTPFISDVVYLEGVVLDVREKIQGLIFEVRVQFQHISKESLDILDKIERYNVSH